MKGECHRCGEAGKVLHAGIQSEGATDERDEDFDLDEGAYLCVKCADSLKVWWLLGRKSLRPNLPALLALQERVKKAAQLLERAHTIITEYEACLKGHEIADDDQAATWEADYLHERSKWT